jgi:hypothetical protein
MTPKTHIFDSGYNITPISDEKRRWIWTTKYMRSLGTRN